MKSSISRYDYLCGLFSLVTSLLVYGASLLVIAIMVYHSYALKWTFVCYVVSSGWLLVMNITSNVVLITSKKTVSRENPRTCRQTSVNLELLNNPNGTRYLSYPPVERFEQTNRSRLSECVRHTPPPSYEDVSLVVSGENNSESVSSGTATPQESSNDKALYDVLESANEIKKVRETLRGEYGSEKKTQKYSPENQEGWKSRSRKGLDSNQVVVERVVQNLGDENARLILHKRIEERRNQLDRRLEGDSLRKMNEYCMRDLKKDLEKRSPRQPSELSPKESLRRNLKAKYGSSAENFRDIHSSRDSVTSVYPPRNIERFELPRVHTKSTLSLNPSTDDSNCERSVKSSRSSGINSSGLSLQEVHTRGSQPDIRAANEVGLPLDRTFKQKPLKLPDRSSTKVNLDTSFSLKHLDDRKRRDGNPCSRSKSMPGRQTSRENDDGRF